MKSMTVVVDALVVQMAVEFVILHVLMVVRALFLFWVFCLFAFLVNEGYDLIEITKCRLNGYIVYLD